MKKSTDKLKFMVAAVALVAMLAGAALVVSYREADSQTALLPDQVITLFPDPKPLTAFALTDQDGRPFDLARLRRKWSFLFFGYTYCPDVCPTTLALLARVHKKIESQTIAARDIQFVFISVDPHRDTEQKLKQYVGNFDATFLGATGSDRQIANIAGQLGARYQVMFKPGSNSYPVYHTPAVFLVDPQVRYHAVFKPPYDPDVIVARFKLLQQLDDSKAG